MPSLRDKLAGKTTKLARDPAETRTEGHPADLNDFQDGGFYNVDIDAVRPNPHQPRQIFDPQALDELADSIRSNGVLQPILIRREGDQVFLVAGERRLKASRKAGLHTVPTILTKGNPIEISLIENLQRENLKPVEEAEALGRMIDEYKYTQEQLAKAIGKGRSTVTETLSLNKLPEEIKQECRRADLYPRRLLVEIAKQKTPEAMIALFAQSRDGKLTSDQVREKSRKRRNEPRPPTEILSDKVQTLTQTLSSLNLETWNPEDTRSFLAVLEKLGEAVKTIISEQGRAAWDY